MSMEHTKNGKDVVMEDFDDILETLEGEEKNEWDGEWVCQSCEFGPMPEEMKKCDRCGERKDVHYNEDEYDEDGLLKEKYEEIY